MGIFRDEYGDVIAWRVVAAAVAGVAVAVALAFALFGPRPTEDGAEGEAGAAQTVATPASVDPKAELRAWVEGIEGSERLSSFGDATLEGLRVAVTAWERSADAGDCALSVVGEPEFDGKAGTVRLRVVRADGGTWVEARLAEGAWSVEECPDGFPSPDDEVRMTDAAALASLMPEDVAREVSRQVAASGIEGAGASWTTAASARTEGRLTRLSVWFPRDGADPEEWEASFDEAVGMLQIAPRGEALEEEAR